MALAVQNARSMRESPFRESEWDRRLDHLLQDLESSANAGVSKTSATSSSSFQQHHHHQQSSSFYAATSTSAAASNQFISQARSVSQDRDRSATSAHPGYGTVLQKSKSTSSVGSATAGGAATGTMLKDLDDALKASTNYIESHRTVQLPNGTQEYHEYRSTSTSGGHQPGGINDYNLERQVNNVNIFQNSFVSQYSLSFPIGTAHDALHDLGVYERRQLRRPPVCQHGVLGATIIEQLAPNVFIL